MENSALRSECQSLKGQLKESEKKRIQLTDFLQNELEVIQKAIEVQRNTGAQVILILGVTCVITVINTHIKF